MNWMTELEERFEKALPPAVTQYVAAALGGGQSHTEGLTAWEAVRFWPHVLTDVQDVSTSVKVLGTEVATPVLVAPMNRQRDIHPLGEAETARGAAAAGSLLAVSTYTEAPFQDVHEAGAPWWYQVYLLRDRELTAVLVKRAVAAGARALVLTVDVAGLAVPPSPAGNGVKAGGRAPAGPATVRPAGLTADDLAGRAPDAAAMASHLDAGVIEWLGQISGLPVVVKGVLRADDAVRCVGAGAAAVVVSTHGGRRLGPAGPSVHALPAVVAAVGDRAEVYADSGLRSGTGIAAALALGARAVLVGRPVLWGLAADGADGVTHVLTTLTQELRTTMRLLGAGHVTDLREDLLHR